MNQFARPGLAVTELPPVNADDNGKVLGVSDGAWAKVAASGGSDLPDDPAQDGTYNLQNTVSSGTGTLSWASGSSGGGVLEISVDSDTSALNKTWQEIHDAVMSGKLCIMMEELANNVFLHIVTDVFMTLNPGGAITYGVSSGSTYSSTDSADGYPVMES